MWIGTASPISHSMTKTKSLLKIAGSTFVIYEALV